MQLMKKQAVGFGFISSCSLGPRKSSKLQIWACKAGLVMHSYIENKHPYLGDTETKQNILTLNEEAYLMVDYHVPQ